MCNVLDFYCLILIFCVLLLNTHLLVEQFTKVDAGYTSTDYVTNLVKNHQQCRYISITNADNVYGSEIVAGVLTAAVNPDTLDAPDMLLAPLDSRNFAEHGEFVCE